MIEPIQFVPVRHVFKAMVAVKMLADVSGWVDGDKLTRKKWNMPAGTVQVIDEVKAREFVAKGYAVFVNEPLRPLSDDEIAEHAAGVTRIEMGG